MTSFPDSLPSWLLEPPPAPRSGGGGASLAGRFVAGLGRFLEEAFAAEALTGRRGLLQSLDPRAKLVGLVALVVAAALSTSLAALLVLLAAGVALVLLSRLDVRGFATRAWLVIPLLTLLVALPATTSWVTPGPALVHLWGSGSLARAPVFRWRRGWWFASAPP